MILTNLIDLMVCSPCYTILDVVLAHQCVCAFYSLQFVTCVHINCKWELLNGSHSLVTDVLEHLNFCIQWFLFINSYYIQTDD